MFRPREEVERAIERRERHRKIRFGDLSSVLHRVPLHPHERHESAIERDHLAHARARHVFAECKQLVVLVAEAMPGYFVNHAPQRAKRRDRTHHEAATSTGTERVGERFFRIVEMLDDIEQAHDVDFALSDRLDPLREVVNEELRARSPSRRPACERRMPFHPDDVVPNVGEVRRDAAAPTSQLEKPRPRTDAKRGESVLDEAVAARMPEMPVFGLGERAHRGVVPGVEPFIALVERRQNPQILHADTLLPMTFASVLHGTGVAC